MVTPEEMAAQQAEVDAINNPQTQPEQKQDKGILGRVTDFVADGLYGVADVVKGVMSAPTKAVEDTLQFGHDAVNWADNKFFDGRFIADDTEVKLINDWWRPKTTAGTLAHNMAAIAVGLIAGVGRVPGAIASASGFAKTLSTAPKAVKLGSKAVGSITRQAVVSAVHSPTEGGRLADLLADAPLVGKFIPEFLQSDPNDTIMDMRMKNMVESIFIDAGIEIGGIFRAFKSAQKIQNVSKGGGFISLDPKVQRQLMQEISDESVVKLLKEQGINPEAGFSGTMTKEASIVRAKEAIQRDGKAVLKDLKKSITGHAGKDTGINAGKYHSEAKAFAKNINDKIKILTKDNHMNMAEEGAKALETCLNIGADKLIDVNALRKKTGGMSQIEKITTLNVYADFFLGPKLEIARKNLMDGVSGSEQEIRELIKAGYEIFADLKMEQFKAGQAVKAGDITNVLSRAITKARGAFHKVDGREALKAVSETVDIVKYADDIVSKMSSIELEKMGTELYARSRNGGDIVDVFLSNLAVDDMLLGGVERNPLWNTLLKYRAASLLSGVGTHVRNLGGNVQKMMIHGVEEPVKAMYLGAQRNGWKGLKEGAAEGIDYWAGTFLSMPAAFDAACNAWEIGQSISHNSEMGQLTKQFANAKNLGAGEKYYANPIFKLMASVDEAFAVMAGSGKAYQVVQADWRKSGLLDGITDAGQAQAIKEWFFRDRFSKAMLDVTLPNGQVVKNARFGIQEAVDIADSVTMQRVLGKWGEGFIKFADSNPLMQILFPFKRTTANMVDDIFLKRGAGIPFELRNAWKSGNPEQMATALGHLVSGTIMWGSAYALYRQGKIRGSVKHHGVAKDAAYLDNKLPYSVQIGDNWYSMQNLGVAADAMMAMADFMELSDYTDETTAMDIADGALSTALAVTLDKNYFIGFSQLIRSIQNQDTYSGMGVDTLLSWLPNLATETGRAIDPTIRQARTVTERLRLKLGLTHSLAPKASWITGEDLTYPHGGGLSTYNPAVKSSPRNDVVLEELEKASGIGAPSGKINGRILSSWDKYEFEKLHGTIKIGGKTMYEALEEVILSRSYDANRRHMDDDAPNKLCYQRNRMIEDIIKQYRDATVNEWSKRYNVGSYIAQPSMDSLSEITNF